MNTAPRRILVVEDDAACRETLCAILLEAGYRPLASDRPVSPVDVQQLRADLIVTDLMMHGEPEGHAWLEALRGWRWTADLPILVCSGFLAEDAPAAIRVRALATATLPKPFELDAFLHAVEECLAAPIAPVSLPLYATSSIVIPPTLDDRPAA